LKEDQQIGNAVRVHIGQRANDLPGRRIEILNEIELIVEIAIGLTTNENAVFVEFFDVRSPVEVRVDGDAGDAPVTAIGAPHVRPSIAIQIFG